MTARRARRGAQKELYEPGTRIGKYEVIRELGRGGMGAVFLARDIKLGRRVAIKFLISEKPELNARFLLEARATAQFQHENIIVIHEVDEFQGHPFMVLEYLQGAALGKLLKDGRKLTERRSIDIMTAVARALERAHSHNIVHRDLKPDNVFLTDDGAVKVLDFGIAKLMQNERTRLAAPGDNVANMLSQISGLGPDAPAVNTVASTLGAMGLGQDDTGDSRPTTGVTGQTDITGESKLTRHGAIVGTLPYMSPEQWGAGQVDHRSDLWACGIMLFRMVAGKHPLAPMRGAQLAVTGIVDIPMPRARDVCPGMSESLARIVDRCLLKDKDRRIGTAAELLCALEELHSGASRSLRVADIPYTGLSSFQEGDASRFFGRTREIAAAVTRLRKQPLMGVVGPSGVGKSSFVRAGLVPALKNSGESWSTLVVRPGRQPVLALAQAIAPMVGRDSSVSVSDDLQRVQQIHQRLYREPGYLGVVLRARARREGRHLLLFVDQFEELYTLVADPNERMAFTRCLTGVADDATTPLRVVISIRSDFLDRVPEDDTFMAELSQGLFFLTPPGRAGLRDALIQPAEMAGFQFENQDMVERMLDHLEHTPGALPLLQFAATKLWELRDTDRRLLTQHSYDAIGGIAGALASHADSVLAELPSASKALARSVFVRLVTPERTRAIVSVTDLRELSRNPSDVQRLLDHLVQARLVVMQTGDGSGAASAEIVHESLIHSWPLLRKWLDEGQDDAQFLEQLRNAAKQWQAKGHAFGLLWRGEAMEEARLWRRRYRGQLPELQERYLNAVFALANRSTRRRRMALIALIVFLCGLVAAGAVALVAIREAQKAALLQAEEARVARANAESARAAAERAKAQLEQQKDKLEENNGKLVAAAESERMAREQAVTAQESAQREADRAQRAERDARRKAERARRAERRAERETARAKAAERAAERDAVRARKAEQAAERDALRARRAEKAAEKDKAKAERALAENKRLLDNAHALVERLGVAFIIRELPE